LFSNQKEKSEGKTVHRPADEFLERFKHRFGER